MTRLGLTDPRVKEGDDICLFEMSCVPPCASKQKFIKTFVDSEVLSNYRPASAVLFLSKVTV